MYGIKPHQQLQCTHLGGLDQGAQLGIVSGRHNYY